MEMKDENCLSVEQMFELEQLGVDTSTASMCIISIPGKIEWRTYVGVELIDGMQQCRDYATKTFSVADMLKMMPKEIEEHTMAILNFGDGWFVCYVNSRIHRLGICDMRKDKLIDAVYSAFFQLAKDGKLINQINRKGEIG